MSWPRRKSDRTRVTVGISQVDYDYVSRSKRWTFSELMEAAIAKARKVDLEAAQRLADLERAP